MVAGGVVLVVSLVVSGVEVLVVTSWLPVVGAWI